MSSELFTVCLWAGYGGSRSIFRLKRETQSDGLSREQFPTEHDSSSGTRTSTATVETEKTESGWLHVNYFCLMFNFLLLMFVKWL